MLISLTLYALGVPLWMLLGMVVLLLWNRRRAKNQRGAFAVKVRKEPPSGEDKPAKWPRMVGYAQWVHDVLILRTGIGLMVTTPHGIADIEEIVRDVPPDSVKGLGEKPVLVRARLGDGSIMQIAIEEIRPDLAPDRFLEGQGQALVD